MAAEVQSIAKRAELAAGFIHIFQEFVHQLLVSKGFLVNYFVCPKFFRPTSFVTREKSSNRGRFC